MGLKHVLAALTAVSLSATPTLASAQSAPPAIERAGPDEEGRELYGRGSLLLPLALLALVILVLVVASVDFDGDDDEPVSP